MIFIKVKSGLRNRENGPLREIQLQTNLENLLLLYDPVPDMFPRGVHDSPSENHICT
jgi:hypothetical protein